MYTITGEVAIQSLHDQVVSLVAQRWAKSFQCKVTINPGSETNEPDVLGWQFSPGGNRVEWIAEVETEESLTEMDRYKRWQAMTHKSLPFYLFVPKGYRSKVRHLAVMAGVDLNGIYEYAFLNEAFQLS
ncbi:MAG: hypothetical protein ACKOCD_11515 [Nitrospiraceae bacterium]